MSVTILTGKTRADLVAALVAVRTNDQVLVISAYKPDGTLDIGVAVRPEGSAYYIAADGRMVHGYRLMSSDPAAVADYIIDVMPEAVSA